MRHDDLPPAATRFIRDHIRSVGHLEVLLQLREAADEGQTVEQINRRQRTSIAAVEQVLAQFAAQGFVRYVEGSEPARYLFAPASEPLKRDLEELAVLYADFPVRVITIIHSSVGPMQSFADAFRIRKDPPAHG